MVNTRTISRMREDLDLIEKSLISTGEAIADYYASRVKDWTIEDARELMSEEIFWKRDEVFQEGIATDDGPGPKADDKVKAQLLAPNTESTHDKTQERDTVDRLRSQLETQAIRAAMERWDLQRAASNGGRHGG